MPPEEKDPFSQALDNLDPDAPPDQKGTTSQGWTRRDTERRKKFEQINRTKKREFDKPDEQPTDPKAQQT